MLLAVARVGHIRACPLDLHALVPVPAELSCFSAPTTRTPSAWLWQHWGTHAGAAPRGAGHGHLPGHRRQSWSVGEDRLQLSFWSADWTPWRAFERIRADWPTLWFDLQPQYDVG